MTEMEEQRSGRRETEKMADTGQTEASVTCRHVQWHRNDGVMSRRHIFTRLCIKLQWASEEEKFRKEMAAMWWGRGEGTRTNRFFLAFVSLSNARGAEMQARSPRDTFPPTSCHSARLLSLQGLCL